MRRKGLSPHDVGLKALDELMRADAARIVGANRKHRAELRTVEVMVEVA